MGSKTNSRRREIEVLKLGGISSIPTCISWYNAVTTEVVINLALYGSMSPYKCTCGGALRSLLVVPCL